MAWWPKAKLYSETNNDKRNDMPSNNDKSMSKLNSYLVIFTLPAIQTHNQTAEKEKVGLGYAIWPISFYLLFRTPLFKIQKNKAQSS